MKIRRQMSYKFYMNPMESHTTRTSKERKRRKRQRNKAHQQHNKQKKAKSVWNNITSHNSLIPIKDNFTMAKGQKTKGVVEASEKVAAAVPAVQVEERLQISLSKALKHNAKWDTENFAKFPDVVHWLRQVIALLCGVVCGILPITGMMAITAFLFLNTYIPYYYYTSYANVNVDDFGAQKLLMEGYQPSFALFMLAWVLVYSSTHL
jgi:hypothetical protein